MQIMAGWFRQRATVVYRLVAALVLAVAVGLAWRAPNGLRQTHMPDAWAYAFAAENFARGQWVVTEDDLAAGQMRARLEGGHLTQYVYLASDRYALEKAPGFPLLAVPFQWLGYPQLTNSVLAVLAALAVYAAFARWRNEGTACLALALFLLTPMTLMALRDVWMDTFSSGALAAGGGALYALYALRGRRDAAGLALLGGAGFGLGWAVVVRLTNAPVLGLCGLHLLVSLWRGPVIPAARPAEVGRRGPRYRRVVRPDLRERLKGIAAFGLGAALALSVLAVYNQVVFGRWFDLGYAYSTFRISSVLGPEIGQPATPASTLTAGAALQLLGRNLARIPRPWLAGFPLLVLALPGWFVAWPRPAAPKPLLAWWLATLWTLAVLVPYLSFTWLDKLLSLPPQGDYFVEIDRYFFPWLFPLLALALTALERLPRWVTVGLVALYCLGSVWVYRQALG